MKPDTMDAVFQALANRHRRKMLDLVKSMPGCSVNDVCNSFDMSRIAVMKHLRILEDAGLLISRKPGRTRELFFNAVPIQLIYDRWTTEYSQFWASQLADLKFRVEAAATKPGGTSKSRGK
jgi:predicted transcriptional regulator